MKPLPTAGMKTPAKIKQLAKFFMKPGLQGHRDESSMDWSEDYLKFSPHLHLMSLL